MNKLIEEEKQEIYYQLPKLDMSHNLEETYISVEQFDQRFGMVKSYLKWTDEEATQYRKYLWSLNHIMKHEDVIINKSGDPLDFSMSLHSNYPVELFSYGIRTARGHPYVVRTPRKLENGEDIITQNEIIDALYAFRLNDETDAINNIIDKDLRGLLFEKDAEFKFLNYPDESYSIPCTPGYRTELMNKHNTSMKALHWGQRKLILSEIRFITKVIAELGLNVQNKNEKISLIYPGAAPGTHFMLLMEMFPQLVMYLWDPAIFIDNLLYTDIYRRTGELGSVPNECCEFVKRYNGRIFICPDMIGEEWDQYLNNVLSCQKEKNLEPELGFFKDSSLDWIKENVDVSKAMFVSDIRLFKNNDILKYQHVAVRSIYDPVLSFVSGYAAVEDHHRDMDLQRDWYTRSGIRFGLLKFKLDRTAKIGQSLYQEYPLGEIMLQSWAPYMSTESRLFVDSTKTKTAYYNISKYEDMMKYFNKIVRHTTLGDEKLCKHGIDIYEDEGRDDLTLAHVWKIILPQSLDRIGMDCLTETKIIYDYLKMHKEKVSLFDIIHVISDITKSLKLKTPIRFSIKTDYHQSRALIKKRSHFSHYFQSRLDFTSIQTDLTPFPQITHQRKMY
jgi:hypothetical protein